MLNEADIAALDHRPSRSGLSISHNDAGQSALSEADVSSPELDQGVPLQMEQVKMMGDHSLPADKLSSRPGSSSSSAGHQQTSTQVEAQQSSPELDQSDTLQTPLPNIIGEHLLPGSRPQGSSSRTGWGRVSAQAPSQSALSSSSSSNWRAQARGEAHRGRSTTRPSSQHGHTENQDQQNPVQQRLSASMSTPRNIFNPRDESEPSGQS